MQKELKVIYEPHPVSKERKAELNAQGYKVVDAIFAHDDVQQEEKASTKRPTKNTRKPKEVG